MEAAHLSEQFTALALSLAGMLQTVWQFTAFVTLGAIGWGLTTGRHRRQPTVLARMLVALGLGVFYALNIYVLWNLLERFRAAQSLARRYTELEIAHASPETGVIFQDLPNYLLIGTAGIGVMAIVIVFVLMGSSGKEQA